MGSAFLEVEQTGKASLEVEMTGKAWCSAHDHGTSSWGGNLVLEVALHRNTRTHTHTQLL